MYSVKNTSNIFFSLSLEERKTRLAKASVCLFIFRIKYEAGVCYLRQNAFDTVGVVFCPPSIYLGKEKALTSEGQLKTCRPSGAPEAPLGPQLEQAFWGGCPGRELRKRMGPVLFEAPSV